MTENENQTVDMLHKAFGLDPIDQEKIARRDEQIRKLAERLGVSEGADLSIDLRLGNGETYSVFAMMHALLDRMDKFESGLK